MKRRQKNTARKKQSATPERGVASAGNPRAVVSSRLEQLQLLSKGYKPPWETRLRRLVYGDFSFPILENNEDVTKALVLRSQSRTAMEARKELKEFVDGRVAKAARELRIWAGLMRGSAEARDLGRNKGGRPRKVENYGRVVNTMLSEVATIFQDARELRMRFPDKYDRVKLELNKKGYDSRAVDAVLASRNPTSATCRYVVALLSTPKKPVRIKTIRNAYSKYLAFAKSLAKSFPKT